MIRLGVSTAECRAALQEYLRTIALLDRPVREADCTETGDRLRDLRFHLDVDVAARATVEGQARMSAVESVVLEPTLRDMRVTLQSSRPDDRAESLASSLKSIASTALDRLQEFEARH
jgi:hypothetical protein